MPQLVGMDVIKELAKHPQSPQLVICSVETDREVVKAALQVGVLAYVFKIRVHKDLVLAAKSALQGKPLYHRLHSD